MLSLDYPYQQEVADRLRPYKQNWEPNGMVGGSYQFVEGSRFQPEYFKYAQPGSSPSYPMYNMVDLRRINKQGGKLKGGAVSDNLVDELVSVLDGNIELEGNGYSGGAVNLEKIKALIKPIIKPLGSKVLDFGIPALSTAVATELGAPFIGPFVGKAIREIIRAKTGVGRKQGGLRFSGGLSDMLVRAIQNNLNLSESQMNLLEDMKPVVLPLLKSAASKGLDIAIPKLTRELGRKLGNEEAGRIFGKIARDFIKQKTGVGRKGPYKRPAIQQQLKPLRRPLKIEENDDEGVAEYKGGKRQAKRKPNLKAQQRGQLIKKIMKEKNMTLPQASKYIKENNL